MCSAAAASIERNNNITKNKIKCIENIRDSIYTALLLLLHCAFFLLTLKLPLLVFALLFRHPPLSILLSHFSIVHYILILYRYTRLLYTSFVELTLRCVYNIYLYSCYIAGRSILQFGACSPAGAVVQHLPSPLLYTVAIIDPARIEY
jgi:hypothetical protein